MKILITGGAGFIGSHLVEYIVRKGHSVIVIDDLSAGSKENLLSLEGDKSLEVYYDTIENENLLEECIKKVDFVFHLAAAVGVKKIIEDPIDSMRCNIYGTDLVLRYVDKYKKPTQIASTSEVYGKSIKPIFEENDDIVFGAPCITRWSYACAKAMDEHMALAYKKHRSLPVFITRFFNIVGPRQSDEFGMVIPRFMKQALLNEDITIFGDGSQARCFLHVYDAVWALYKLMEKRESLFGEIYNLGSVNEITIKELAIKIVAKTNSSSKIRYIEMDKVYNNEGAFEDVNRRKPSLKKIYDAISFKPKYNLDDIIHDVYNTHRSSAAVRK